VEPSKAEVALFTSVGAFYPFYLSQHRVRWNRRLHFIGTSFVLLLVAAALVLRNGWPLAGLPLAGYGFAWAGHFFYEKNRPATFTHPIYSLICDFRMYWDIWRGRLSA
jgi:hypothetical protein